MANKNEINGWWGRLNDCMMSKNFITLTKLNKKISQRVLIKFMCRHIVMNLATFDISEKFSNIWYFKRICNLWHLRFFLFYVVWGQMLKRVISTWNFNMGIWNLNMESCIYNYFNQLENFSDQRLFSWSCKKKIKGIFNIFFDMVNLNEMFYVMKVIGKIHSGIFVVGRIVNFHFRTNLEFSDFRFWRY